MTVRYYLSDDTAAKAYVCHRADNRAEISTMGAVNGV